MSGRKKKVFVAFSGGVDSSSSTALLLQNGFDCEGVYIITSDQGLNSQLEAETIAEKLCIKLHILDLRGDFERILNYFCDEYSKGRTPNPCVFCNRYIKFSKLWDYAKDNGAEFIATGHYARIFKHNSNAGLYESFDPSKDQSYVLSMIDKRVLPKIILPMGNYTKSQTREMAAKFGLGTEHKAESQEICFIPGNDYVSVLEKMRPGLAQRGKIVDSSGKLLGEHNGIHKFTIGQRRGLKIAMGKPYYVVRIDYKDNTIVLGPKQDLKHRLLWATDVNWLSDKPTTPFRAIVKIRYNDRGTSAIVIPRYDDVVVEFNEDKESITPGQLAVFYVQEGDNNKVVGGGWIDKSGDEKSEFGSNS